MERQPKSRQLSGRAVRALAGGVTSSWQITRPQSVWISHGVGSKNYDVDGTEYVDMHGGYGAGLAGHAHPAIVEAVRRRVVRSGSSAHGPGCARRRRSPGGHGPLGPHRSHRACQRIRYRRRRRSSNRRRGLSRHFRDALSASSRSRRRRARGLLVRSAAGTWAGVRKISPPARRRRRPTVYRPLYWSLAWTWATGLPLLSLRSGGTGVRPAPSPVDTHVRLRTATLRPHS